MKKLFVILSLVIFIASCQKKDIPSELPQELLTAKNNVFVEISALQSTLAFNSNKVQSRTDDTVFIRQTLRDLVALEEYPLEYAFVNPAGILQIIEPPIYYPFEGSDISQQAHIIKAFRDRTPVLSRSFNAVEGINAVVLIHPILLNQSLKGGLTALFQAHTLLQRVIEPLVEGNTFEIWVMEKGGLILYDQDENELGLNVFTDPVYASFPELLAAAAMIDNEKEGKTSYSFFQAGTNNRIEKEAHWTTFEFSGTEWKIVLAKPL